MCFLVDDDESDDGTGTNSGSPKLQLKNQHTWLIPRRALMVVLAVSIVMLVLGLILLAIGGGIASTGLKAVGGILLGFGIIGLVVCFLVCLYAYFFYGTRDQSVQTEVVWAEEYLAETPGYASIGRPSALKSTDSTLKRNGAPGVKKVTMAPDVGPYGESPPNALQSSSTLPVRGAMGDKGPMYGSNNVFLDDGSGQVTTGGIRITPNDGSQPFPSPGGHVVYTSTPAQVHSSAGGGHVLYGGGGSQVMYAGGGSSSASGSMETYAYPKNSGMMVSGPESGFSDTSRHFRQDVSGYDTSGSGSQYSTLRSIPVTHVVSDPQKQQHQQHQETVEYARVNKSGKSTQGGSIGGGSISSTSSSAIGIQQQQGPYIIQGQNMGSSYIVQGQSGTVQHQQAGGSQQRYSVEEDFDYDNPVERTPMLPPKQGSQNLSYHERQMQFQHQKRLRQMQQQQQQQHQQDLHAPRQLHVQSLQRQTGPNPYHMQQQQQFQQQQQQQHQHYQTSQSSSERIVNAVDDLPPEPQPLVYPSARRPMTFEQVSSSKMSVYDNVLAGLKDVDEDE